MQFLLISQNVNNFNTSERPWILSQEGMWQPWDYRIQGNHNFSKYEDLIQLQWNMSWKFLKFVTLIYLYLILLSGQLIQQGKSFPCLYPQLYISTVQHIRQVFQVSKYKWKKKLWNNSNMIWLITRFLNSTDEEIKDSFQNLHFL